MSSALVRRTPVMAICWRAASRIASSVVTVTRSPCLHATNLVVLLHTMTTEDITLADIIEESMLLLGAGSTVLYQLALLGVGRGVAEHSTTLTRPVDRLRTTLTYVYV